jgi:phage N-6-adenine-methyltransferase
MQDSLFNVVTDGVTTNDYYTPKWLFDRMELEFDLDVAAPLQGIPWLPAKRWFSQADDGLAQDWGKQLVWMNPPFSHATPWVQKFMENGNGIALVPVSRSKWFGDIWERADGILTTPPDFKFERPDGKNQTISFQTFLFAIGEQSVAALERTKLGRVR